MRMFVPAAFGAAFFMSGCTQTLQSVDTAVQKNLPQICTAATTAHAAFVIIAASAELSARTINQERVAYAAVEVICRDPAGVSTATALVTAAQAYEAITRALREAEAAGA